jgi:hypothetical protein
MSEFKLCYVDGSFAYFTTRELDKQWGDDWDDAPYEHNAGEPYEFHDHDKARGIEPWEILKVCYEAELETPASMCSTGNSRYSVMAINSGAVAWLTTPTWSSKEMTCIPAGVSPDEFKRLIRKAGGKVYVLEADSRH